MLMAFVDGELEGEEAAQLERAIEASPELQSRAEMFLTTRLKAQTAFRSTLNEPVPERLLKAATGIERRPPVASSPEAAQVLPFDRPTSRTIPVRNWSRMAIAASLATFLAAGTAGFLLGRGGGTPGNAMAGLFANEPSIAALLGSAPDGTRRDIAGQLSVAITATYRMGNQSYCRTFDVAHGASGTAAQAFACRNATGWRIAGALPSGEKDGTFHPAGAGASIEALLDAAGAGEALPATETETLIRNAWR
jgi:hypothetical protein